MSPRGPSKMFYDPFGRRDPFERLSHEPRLTLKSGMGKRFSARAAFARNKN